MSNRFRGIKTPVFRVKISNHYEFKTILGYLEKQGYEIIKMVSIFKVVYLRAKSGIYTGSLAENVYVDNVKKIEAGEA